MKHRERIILVTGGANGIGAAAAKAFAEQGAAKLYLIDLDDENGLRTEKRLQALCPCEYIHLNVTSEIAVTTLFQRLKAQGTVDILFNCAGITSVKSLMETDLQLWNQMMAVNVTSAFLFSKEAMRLMCRQGRGRIINVASISAFVGGIRTSPAYAASKAALVGLTRALAKYGAPHHVTVNAVAPGLVDTDMTRSDDFAYSTSEIPLGYTAAPKDIADLVLFLAGEEGGYITGQCIHCNGGMFFG